MHKFLRGEQTGLEAEMSDLAEFLEVALQGGKIFPGGALTGDHQYHDEEGRWQMMSDSLSKMAIRCWGEIL